MRIKPTINITEITSLPASTEMNFGELLTDREWQLQMTHLNLLLTSAIDQGDRFTNEAMVLGILADIALVDRRRLPELAFDSDVMTLLTHFKGWGTEANVKQSAEFMLTYHQSVTEQFPLNAEINFHTAYDALKQRLNRYDQSTLPSLLSNAAYLHMLFPDRHVVEVFTDTFWEMIDRQIDLHIQSPFSNPKDDHGLADSATLPMLVFIRMLNPTKFVQLFSLVSTDPYRELEIDRRMSLRPYELLHQVALYKLLLTSVLIIDERGITCSGEDPNTQLDLPSILNY